MKTQMAVGMVVKNESEMLNKLFGFVVASGLDVIAVDKGSSDNTVEDLVINRACVIKEPYGWGRTAGWYLNRVLQESEKQGFKWTLFMDADEAMFPSELISIATSERPEIPHGFRRFNLGGINGEKWAKQFYPDHQIRLIPNNGQWKFCERIPVHATIINASNTQAVEFPILSPHIYHYKATRKDKRDLWLRTYEQCCHQQGIIPTNVEPTKEQCETIDAAKYDFTFDHPLQTGVLR